MLSDLGHSKSTKKNLLGTSFLSGKTVQKTNMAMENHQNPEGDFIDPSYSGLQAT